MTTRPNPFFTALGRTFLRKHAERLPWSRIVHALREKHLIPDIVPAIPFLEEDAEDVPAPEPAPDLEPEIVPVPIVVPPTETNPEAPVPRPPPERRPEDVVVPTNR